MESYLIYCRENLKNLEKFKEVHVVLGNESCDLDSAVSSLVIAFLYHQVKSTKNRIIIPILNISRKDISLHSEVTYFLEETDISIDIIICRDEIDLKKLYSKKLLYLILVDHNVLPSYENELESTVIEIIDHHIQEFKERENCQMTIEQVGSCCTLVAERVFKTDEKLMDPQIALLLYGSIILDTFCLDKAAQIATSKDREIAKKLEIFLDGVSKEEVFEVLHSAKFDPSFLTAEDILRKDLKIISHNNIKVGISAIPCLLSIFNNKFDLEISIPKFCTDNGYIALVIMTLNIEKKTKHITREIAVYSPNSDLQMQICKALELESNLQLRNLNLNIPNLIGYHQENITLSRKFVLPFIQDIVKNISNISSFIITDEDCKNSISSVSVCNEGSAKNGTASYLLGVIGDPISSQSSSNQNSCPYTPQNSCVEDSYELENDPLSLPSFNNRDMIAKIEEKRSKLRGYVGEPDISASKVIPFTPKNSYINISTECSDQDSEVKVFLEQLQGKKDILNQFLEESQLKKQENIEESRCTETTNGASSVNSVTKSIKEKSEIDAGINSRNISPDDSDTFKDSGTEKEQSDNRQKNKFKSFSNIDGSDPLTAAHYLAETVDFPDSPQHLKLLKRRSREAQGITDDDEDDDDTSTVAVISLSEKEHLKCERPTTLNTNCSTTRRRKITVNPDVLSSDMRDEDQKSLSSLSNKSDVDVFSPMDDLVTPDDIDTPDDLDDFTLGNGYSGSDPIPELSATEEIIEERNWKTCFVGGAERKIDMKVIEPYKKVLSHGGYFGPDRHAIIVFGACYLPDRSRHDYDYVMDNLFLYVLTTLDQLVAEDYILVYFHGATRRSNMPSFGWLKRCYQMIDRRLRKNLKGLYLVHPTFWLKTIVIMTRPFISSKFSRKLRFINNLQELSDLIPMDHVCIPDIVKKFDEEKNQDA